MTSSQTPPHVPVDRRRRRTIGRAAAAALLGVVPGLLGGASARAADLGRLVDEVAGGAPVRTGRVRLALPPVAENGFAVPLAVSVESPMTPDDHCESVLVIAPANPFPEVLRFRFTPAAGRAEASTRIRLARDQSVVAIARMSDGSLWTEAREVRVTIGGCGTEPLADAARVR